MTDREATREPTERECSTTPVAQVPATPAALPTITENKNESTDTLVDTKTTTSSGQVSGNASFTTPAPDKISMPTRILGNIERWLPGVSNRDPQAVESVASTPNFQMSPDFEGDNPFQLASSPEYIPLTGPPIRRDSLPDSSVSLAGIRSEEGSVAASRLSEATDDHFRELDALLRAFILENEPKVENVPADQISTEPLTAQEKMAFPFAFECAFGWSGDPQELKETPNSKEAFLGRLEEATNGCTFIRGTLMEYQTEINSRKNHKFNLDFLKRQNEAIVITQHQIDQIEDQIEGFVEEVHAISDDDEGQVLQDSLTAVYRHLYPWVMRTKRVVHDNHVWYKLNYVMGVHAKPRKSRATRPKNPRPVQKSVAAGNGTSAPTLPARNGVAPAMSATPANLPTKNSARKPSGSGA